MEFKDISLARLLNEQHFQFISDFRTEVREVGAESLKIEAEFPHLVELWELENKLLEQIRASEKTATLAELDAVRDEIYMSLRYLILGYSIFPDAAKKEAGKKLMIVEKTYGNVVRDEYRKETGEISNFIEDLKTTYAAEVTTLGLTPILTELDKANKEFNNLYLFRNADTGAKTIDANMHDTRAEINIIYRKLLKRIEAAYILDGGSLIETFIRTWNATIEKYRMIIATHQGVLDAGEK